MKKLQKKIIRFFIIVFGIITLVFFVFNLIDKDTETPEEYFATHYALGWTDFDVYGIIKNKFIDENAHNNPTIIVKDANNKEYSLYFQTNDTVFYNYVQIGDSIMSKRRSFSAKVWNNNLSKTFEFTD